MDFRRYLAGATVCMLILTGCNSGPTVDNEPTPTPITAPIPPGEKQAGTAPTLEPHKFTDAQGLPFPIPSTEANPIISVSRDTAWGGNLDIKEISAAIDDDSMLMLKAVAEDGKTIVGLIVPLDKTSFVASKLVLMDVASLQITEIATKPDEYGSSNHVWAKGASMNREWIVWLEGRTLQVYNIKSHQRSEIKISHEYLDARMPIKETISVDHGIAVWAEATSEEAVKDRIASIVKSVQLATGETSVLGRYGVNPIISWPTVAWIEPDLTTEQEGQVLARLVTLDIQSGATKVLGGLWGFTEVAVSGDTLVWTNWDSGAGTILSNFAETRRQVIIPQQQQSAGHQKLTLNERLVAWSSGDVWDRNLGRLVWLDKTKGAGSAILKGDMLAWQILPPYTQQMGYEPFTMQPEDMKIYLLDTSQLPK